MAHRWCNCDFGKNGGWRNSASHISCDETYFYSYYSAYAMWLDKTEGKKLMVVMDNGGSSTSNKHLWAIVQAIPDDVRVIRTHISGGYCGWSNVEFSRTTWHHQLPYNLLKHLEWALWPFVEGKSIKTRSLLGDIQKYCSEINLLFDKRSECKVKDFNEYLKIYDNKYKKIFRLVRKRLEPEEMVDKFLGDGTYAAFEERISSQLKAEKTRKFVRWFLSTHHGLDCKIRSKWQIDNMPIADKVKHACMPLVEDWQRDSWYNKPKSQRRLAKYLLGSRMDDYHGHVDEVSSNIVVNRFTGERYEMNFERFLMNSTFDFNNDVYWFTHDFHYRNKHQAPTINLEEYKKLKDKDQWLRRFYQKCAIVSEMHKDMITWVRMRDYSDEELNNCTEEDLARYNRTQLKFAQYQVDREARKLAEQKEREYLEAEKKRKEEERKLKYASYVARGIEGYRDLYYEKLDGIGISSKFGDEFFFGGNVLLRWRTDQLIETSKNIILTIPQAKKIYRAVSIWHQDPSKFDGRILQTKSGNYNTQSYKDDILSAGCHKVAWCEMDRMYNEILKREIA